LDQAYRSYEWLEEYFIKERGKYLINLVWGMLVVPLASERKPQADHYLYFKEYLEHLYDAKIPEMEGQNLLLSRFCKNAFKDP
jgi:hypothetical protein